MSYEWMGFWCFVVAAIVHFFFFILETFLLQKDDAYKRLNISKEAHAAVKVWAFNQGFYNLCLSAITVMGLIFVLKLKVVLAGALLGMAGMTMIVAGLVLWFTAPHLRKMSYLQMLPPFIGLVFSYFHVVQYIQ